MKFQFESCKRRENAGHIEKIWTSTIWIIKGNWWRNFSWSFNLTMQLNFLLMPIYFLLLLRNYRLSFLRLKYRWCSVAVRRLINIMLLKSVLKYDFADKSHCFLEFWLEIFSYKCFRLNWCGFIHYVFSYSIHQTLLSIRCIR